MAGRASRARCRVLGHARGQGAAVRRDGDGVDQDQREDDPRGGVGGQTKTEANDRGQDLHGRDRAMPACSHRELVPEDARRHREECEGHADRDGAHGHVPAAGGRDERPERHDPGAHPVQLEAVGTIAEDVAQRRAVQRHLHVAKLDPAARLVLIEYGRFGDGCERRGIGLHRHHSIVQRLVGVRLIDRRTAAAHGKRGDRRQPRGKARPAERGDKG